MAEYKPLQDDDDHADNLRAQKRKRHWTFFGCALFTTLCLAAAMWPFAPTLSVKDVLWDGNGVDVKFCGQNPNVVYESTVDFVSADALWLIPSQVLVSETCSANSTCSADLTAGHCAVRIASSEAANATTVTMHVPPHATRCADAFHLAPQSDEDLACLWDMMNAQVTHGMQKIALNVKAVARVANTWVYDNVNVR